MIDMQVKDWCSVRLECSGIRLHILRGFIGPITNDNAEERFSLVSAIHCRLDATHMRNVFKWGVEGRRRDPLQSIEI
jgi:hypothetical protein